MADTRKSLKKGTVLKLDKDFVVLDEIGRGAGCLVYDGYYADPLSGRHRVRIKECYPCRIKAERGPRGELMVDAGSEETFRRAKEVFSDAYKKGIRIRNRLGLTNATADAVWIAESNHTLYTVTGYVEGADYRESAENCLKDVFTRMKRLCVILENYHACGYLHLDIKPENILIPADTKEQIILFDFDSLLEMDGTEKAGEVRIPYSDGFSAPELLNGGIGRIGTAADIYSIGAVVFYKLFGRAPGALDRAWDAEYDFSAICFSDERYQPKLFYRLAEFFHKTLSTAPSLRYRDMGAAREALAGLEKLADVEGMVFMDHFFYSFPGFVGRSGELSRIREIFFDEGTDVVFLSGMGGIGKTETARRFAHAFRRRFNRIVFLRFAGTIQETVCSDELMIAGCVRDEQESLREFYERKLSVLRNNATKEDLVILDNLDNDESTAAEDDEDLNDLLGCGCRILVTSREDFWREYGYAQIDIGPLKKEEEWGALFRNNNGRTYPKEEQEAVRDLVDFFDGHTMAVALAAKHLRHTGRQPSKLLAQMMQKEGMANAGELPVRHNKDEVRRRARLYSHLQTLFDLSGFDRTESEIMGSLSLLGPVRIKKSVFLQYFGPCEDIETPVGRLIDRGWIEYEEKTGKLSLHQIILDLAYHSLQPSSENCPRLTRAMISYFKENENSYVRRENRRRLAEHVMERIGGADELRARLCYEYGRRIAKAGSRQQEQALQEAEAVCRTMHSYESRILMADILQAKIPPLAGSYDWIGLEDEEMDEALNRVYEKACGLEKRICAVLEEITAQIPGVNDVVVQLFLQTADRMEALGDSICEECLMLETSEDSGLARMYREARRLYLYTEKLAEENAVSLEIKETLYGKMAAFYSEEDFVHSIRCSCVGDEAGSARYSEKLHRVREALPGGRDRFYTDETAYRDAAWKAGKEGRYMDALSLYQKALEDPNEIPEDIWCDMGCVHMELHQYEEAEALFLASLRETESKGDDPCAVLEKMAELYGLQEREDERTACYDRLIHLKGSRAARGDAEAAVKVLLYRIEKEKCKDVSKTADRPEETVRQMFETAEACRQAGGLSSAAPLYEYIAKDTRFRKIHQEYYAKSVLWAAADREDRGDHEAALALCRYAGELLKEDMPDKKYAEALLKKTKADIYRYMDDGPECRQQIDYYLLTERELAKRQEGTDAFTAWKEAVCGCMYANDHETAAKCLNRLAEAAKKEAAGESRMRCFLEYCSLCFWWDRENHAMERLSDHRRILYGEFVRYIRRGEPVDTALCRDVLKAVGDCAFKSRAFSTALYACLASVRFLLEGHEGNRIETADTLPEDEAYLDSLAREAEHVFPDSVDADRLDDVVREIDRILAGIEKEERLRDLYAKLQGIRERYKTAQMEFRW